MCGRFNLFTSIEIITEELNVERVLFDPPPRYNIAPTQTVAAVIEDENGRAVDGVKWGLVPPWSKDGSESSSLINARSESLFEKPSFKGPVLAKRCAIPADGFFEWAHTKAGRYPYYIHRADGAPLYMGGIYEDWRAPGSENVRSCAIVTMAADKELSAVHDRMPLLLDRERARAYLDRSVSDRPSVERLLTGPHGLKLEVYRVGTEVNSASVEGKGLIAPLQEWF